MKFNAVLALGLGVWFLNIGAAAHDQKIEIINNSGYDIKVNVGRDKASGGGRTDWTEKDTVLNGKRHIILSRPGNVVKGLLYAYAKDLIGYETDSRSLKPLIDPSDLTQHTNEDLVITLKPYSYVYGSDIEYTWKGKGH